jgi:hypothetical protein
MYLADLAPYSYGLPGPLPEVVAVGWLAKTYPFPQGEVPGSFVEKLERFIVDNCVNRTRGWHGCDYCGLHQIRLAATDPPFYLGSAEVWVPEQNSSRIFAAPNLVHHYITAHSYQPPAAFIRAVDAFDISSAWRGQQACDEAEAKAFK